MAQKRLAEVSDHIGFVEGNVPVFLQRLGQDGDSAPVQGGSGNANAALIGQRSAALKGVELPAPQAWAGGDDPPLVAKVIADHARGRTIPGVRDNEIPQYLEEVLRGPGYRLRSTATGKPRMAWWIPSVSGTDHGTIVIRTGDGGTFMQPQQGRDYLLEQVRQSIRRKEVLR